MSLRLLAGDFLALASASCSPRGSKPTASPPPEVGQQASPPGSITVDGEGLTPAAKEAVAEWTKQLLADAIHKAIQDGADQLARKLRMSDDTERHLLFGNYDWGSPDGEGDTLAIYLVKPGKTEQPPETVEVFKDGRPVIRLTRTWASISRPIAILTRCRISGDRLIRAELCLAYGVDGKWHVTRPTETKETLDRGHNSR